MRASVDGLQFPAMKVKFSVPMSGGQMTYATFASVAGGGPTADRSMLGADQRQRTALALLVRLSVALCTGGSRRWPFADQCW